MNLRTVLIIMGLLAAGCAASPFPRAQRTPLGPEDPAAVVRRFREATPAAFQLLSSVVFEYNWQQFPVMGFAEIDRERKVFRLSGMTPLGVKLFDLEGDRHSVTPGYVIEALARYGDITAAVGADIRRIYFDQVPAEGASVRRRACSLVFRHAEANGFVEHVFAGPDGDLVEKNYYEEDGIVWRASYHAYRQQDGKRFPQGIVFLHYGLGYRLIIREKELRIGGN